MGLTAEKIGRMKRVELVKLFIDDRDEFRELAVVAYEYAVFAVSPSGEKVRHDDVTVALTLPLIHNALFQDHLSQKKLTQNYWLTYFAELIVDQLWEELQKSGR